MKSVVHSPFMKGLAKLREKHLKTPKGGHSEWEMAFRTNQKVVKDVLFEEYPTAIVAPGPEVCHRSF